MRTGAVLVAVALVAGCATGHRPQFPTESSDIKAWRTGYPEQALGAWIGATAALPSNAPDLAGMQAGVAALARQCGLGAISLAARHEAVKMDLPNRWHPQRAARLLLERGDATGALAELGEPADAWGWLTRGQCERRLGRPEEALASFARARAADSNLSLAEQERAETLASASRYAESASAYQAALALDASAVHLKARTARLEERTGQAAAAYERWRQLGLVDPSSTIIKEAKIRLARADPRLARAEVAREADRARDFTETPAPTVDPLPPVPLSPLAVGIVTEI